MHPLYCIAWLLPHVFCTILRAEPVIDFVFCEVAGTGFVTLQYSCLSMSRCDILVYLSTYPLSIEMNHLNLKLFKIQNPRDASNTKVSIVSSQVRNHNSNNIIFTIPPLLRLLRHSALLACCTTSSSYIRPIHSFKMSNVLQVKFLSLNAKMPTRGSPQSAGFDLSAAEPKVVPAGGRAVIKTDLSIACPEGTYARIAPRR